MKKSIKRSVIIIGVSLLMWLIPFFIASAQFPPLPVLPIDPIQAPIDGGLSILALAGGAYAFKRVREK